MPLAMASLFLVFLLPPGKRAVASIKKVDITNGETTVEEIGSLLDPGAFDAPSIAQRRMSYDRDDEHEDSESRLQKSWNTAKKELRQFGRIFTKVPIVRYSYAAMLVQALGKQQLHILLQYVSKRFGTTIAQVSVVTYAIIQVGADLFYTGWLLVLY